MLTQEQKQSYQQHGFLILPDFFSKDDCDVLMSQAKQLIASASQDDNKTVFSTLSHKHEKERYFLDSGDKIRCFYEDGAFDEQGELNCDVQMAINKIGHALHDIDPVFRQFSRADRLSSLLTALDIQDPVLYQSMYICKQPRIGGEVTCHQDSTYLYIEDQPVTGLWFALEDATLENGCLWAIPGGHATPLKSRLLRDQHDNISVDVYDNSPWNLDEMIPLEVSRGTLIVLHGMLPHMSKENTSSRSRHAYTLHVGSALHPFAENNWIRLKNQAM